MVFKDSVHCSIAPSMVEMFPNRKTFHIEGESLTLLIQFFASSMDFLVELFKYSDNSVILLFMSWSSLTVDVKEDLSCSILESEYES